MILIALISGCTGASGPVTPTKVPAPVEPRLGVLVVEESGVRLKATGAAPTGPVALLTSRGWPEEEGVPRPAVAAVAFPTGGDTWEVVGLGRSVRAHGADAVALDAVRERARRLPVVAGALRGEALELDEPPAPGDRLLVLKPGASAPDAILARAFVDERGVHLRREAPGDGPVLVVRVGFLAEPMQEPVKVALQAKPGGGCAAAHLDALFAALTRDRTEGDPFDPQRVEADAELEIVALACAGERVEQVELRPVGHSPLLRSPLWAPTTVTFPTSPELRLVRALVADFAGAHDVAISALVGLELQQDAHRLLAAALLIDGGLPGAALALLRGDGRREPALLAAGVQLTVGNPEGARAALGKLDAAVPAILPPDPSQPTVAEIQVAMGHLNDPRGAAAALKPLYEQAPADSMERAVLGLSYGRALLNAQDGEGLKAHIAALGPLIARFPELRGLELQLQGWSALVRGDTPGALKALEGAAKEFRAHHEHREAAATWRVLSTIYSEPNLRLSAVEASVDDAAQSRDLHTLAESGLGAWTTFAELHAANAEPPPEGPQLLQRLLIVLYGAGRFDLSARAHRYNLLLLPANADINARAQAMRTLLDDALRCRDFDEIALAHNLLARLEASRFRYKEAERLLTTALAFARAYGQPDYVALIEQELKKLQSQ